MEPNNAAEIAHGAVDALHKKPWPAFIVLIILVAGFSMYIMQGIYEDRIRDAERQRDECLQEKRGLTNELLEKNGIIGRKQQVIETVDSVVKSEPVQQILKQSK